MPARPYVPRSAWPWTGESPQPTAHANRGPMSALPAEMPMFTRDLMQEADRSGITLPEQDPPVHHALHDARHEHLIAQAIGLVK